MTLRIRIESGRLAETSADALVVFVAEGGFAKQAAFAELDAALGGALLSHVDAVRFRGKPDEIIDIPTLGRIQARRAILVGVGPRRGARGSVLRSAAAVAARSAGNEKSLALAPGDLDKGLDLRCVAEGVGLGAYAFAKYFTGERAPKRLLEDVAIVRRSVRLSNSERRDVEQGLAVASAVNICRDAVNEPPNVLYPEELANAARRVARAGKLRVTVLDEKQIKKAGMNLHAAVGQGSVHPPRFIHLAYVPKRAKSKVVFVGKGLTFDSGGLCIKPAAGMGDMKNDMGGAAAVLGTMAAIGAIRPDVEVHGIIAAAENMPDGNAYRPADVFKSLDGKTVEIINTDAEGRLVLADALAYARKLKPDVLVDAATLTGACVIALGKTCSAYFTADERLARRFKDAADSAGEQFWRLPLIEDLRDQLTSDIADLKHTGERFGGSITAALFLKEFAGDAPWIHCDIAGPVTADRQKGIYPKGATGHPVLTFIALVEALGREK